MGLASYRTRSCSLTAWSIDTSAQYSWLPRITGVIIMHKLQPRPCAEFNATCRIQPVSIPRPLGSQRGAAGSLSPLFANPEVAGSTHSPPQPDGINLDGRSHALAHIILSRVLWYIEHLEPALAKRIFPGMQKFEHLADMCVKFAWGEPYINRYTEGGCFDPHTDGHALTILVPLSTPEADFSAGGTAFWSSHIATDSESAKSVPPSLVLAPEAGTGIFWRGHMTHAGLAVSKGVRHVFVASFDLKVRGPPTGKT